MMSLSGARAPRACAALPCLVAVFVAGCLSATPKEETGMRELEPAYPALAAGVDHAVESLAGARGVDLFTQRWRPQEEPRAVVLIVHGLEDHSDRYAGFATRLVRAGYAVYAFDLPGHGRSAGRRVTVRGFDE